MIVVYFYVAHLLAKVNSYKYLDPSPNSYNKHTSLHKYITSINETPYHVLIAYSSLYCSGSLIRSRVVVTVASCFIKWNDQRIVVKVGSGTITGFGQVIEVTDVKTHEYHNYNGIFDNDIALLMLSVHVVFSNIVQKVPLIESDTALQDSTTLDVSGWGSAIHHSPKYANYLLSSEMILIKDNECTSHFPYLKSESNFCARYPPERGLSDNGGGAVYRGLLVGILSYGTAKSDDHHIALLTNVSYFNRWISLNTVRLLKMYCKELPGNYKEEYFRNVFSEW